MSNCSQPRQTLANALQNAGNGLPAILARTFGEKTINTMCTRPVLLISLSGLYGIAAVAIPCAFFSNLQEILL